MRVSDFDFHYPPELVACEPSRPTRVAFCHQGAGPQELSIVGLLERFQSGDVLVVNNTQVIPARVFGEHGLEILFLRPHDDLEWEILCAARSYPVGSTFKLPGDVQAELVGKGLPQKIRTSRYLNEDYFVKYGEMALPPYIQEARGERHNRPQDKNWYQTQWASHLGSVAAPTASLHFSNADFDVLRSKGVNVVELTLHVGAGTFMPLRGEDLKEHVMHAETVFVPRSLLDDVERAKSRGGRIWALGTTVARSLESLAQGLLRETPDGFSGDTRLFIHPPYSFQLVDGLLTNFHQPRSTLLCLVAAFAGLENVKQTYQWAIENKFKLFSYGDLSVWTK